MLQPLPAAAVAMRDGGTTQSGASAPREGAPGTEWLLIWRRCVVVSATASRRAGSAYSVSCTTCLPVVGQERKTPHLAHGQPAASCHNVSPCQQAWAVLPEVGGQRGPAQSGKRWERYAQPPGRRRISPSDRSCASSRLNSSSSRSPGGSSGPNTRKARHMWSTAFCGRGLCVALQALVAQYVSTEIWQLRCTFTAHR